MEEKDAANTKKATKSSLKAFTDYLKEKNYGILCEILDADLPDILDNFYMDLRKKDGDTYKLQSLKCIRARINCYMKEVRNIDITSDLRFVKANECFKAVGKKTMGVKCSN